MLLAVTLISCEKTSEVKGDNTISIPSKTIVEVNPGEIAYQFDTSHLYEFKEPMVLSEQWKELSDSSNTALVQKPTLIQQFLAPFFGDSSKLTAYDVQLSVVPQLDSTYEIHLEYMSKYR